MFDRYIEKTKLLREAMYSSIELPHGEIICADIEIQKPEFDARPIRVTVLDIETASKEPEEQLVIKNQHVIELCMVNIIVDSVRGQVLKIEKALNQLSQPGFKLHPLTTELTGITDVDLKNKLIDEELTIRFVENSDLVIAHNASFDKPILCKEIEYFLEKNWACSCKGDINWDNYGMPSKSLKYLLFEKGYFYNAHRATPDVFALIQLLSDMPEAMYELLKNALPEKFEVRAISSPFHVKEQIKSMGFAPLYIDGVFQYWYKNNLSNEEAIIIASSLAQLYGIEPARIIFKEDKTKKYL